VIPTCILIGLENLSTAALIMAVIVLMMFLGRVPWSQLARLAAFGLMLIVIAGGAVYILGSLDNDETNETQTEKIVNGEVKKDKKKSTGLLHRFGTWKARIDKHLNSEEVTPENYDLDKDAQVAHANIAIVGSNIIGKGPGKSVERDFLPQAFSDFIYVIIIEELGIVGAAFVALLYIVLLYRAARIASRCENNFPAFLVMGLALMLVGTCHWSASAADIPRWHIHHHQLRLYWHDSQHQSFCQKKRRESGAKRNIICNFARKID